MKQIATAASIPGTIEECILNWEWRRNHDVSFGDSEGLSRWISQEGFRNNSVEGDWMDSDSQGMPIQAAGKKPDDAWITTHLWGFEESYGERRHTRRVKMTCSDGQGIKVRMAYDYEGT